MRVKVFYRIGEAYKLQDKGLKVCLVSSLSDLMLLTLQNKTKHKSKIDKIIWSLYIHMDPLTPALILL